MVANLVANPGILGDQRGRVLFWLQQLAELQSHSLDFESLSLRQFIKGANSLNTEIYTRNN